MVLSQYRLELFCDNKPEAPIKGTEPEVRDEKYELPETVNWLIVVVAKVEVPLMLTAPATYNEPVVVLLPEK